MARVAYQEPVETSELALRALTADDTEAYSRLASRAFLRRPAWWSRPRALPHQAGGGAGYRRLRRGADRRRRQHPEPRDHAARRRGDALRRGQRGRGRLGPSAARRAEPDDARAVARSARAGRRTVRGSDGHGEPDLPPLRLRRSQPVHRLRGTQGRRVPAGRRAQRRPDPGADQGRGAPTGRADLRQDGARTGSAGCAGALWTGIEYFLDDPSDRDGITSSQRFAVHPRVTPCTG